MYIYIFFLYFFEMQINNNIKSVLYSDNYYNILLKNL